MRVDLRTHLCYYINVLYDIRRIVRQAKTAELLWKK